jgi:hypothetical protein
MRQLLFSILLFLCLFTFSASAQSSRIPELAEQIQQNISEITDRSAKELFARPANSRNQLNNFLVLQQAKATAESFLLLINNNRPNSELRDAADALNERFSRYESDASNRPQSQQIKKDIEELTNELKRGNVSEDRKPDKKNEVIGRLSWQGTIDDEVHLIIRGNTAQTKTISGTEYADAFFSFSSPLPSANLRVFVNKKDGRGSAKVIQQPTADNDFTAIIQILDKSGGAREYGLEIYWTR